MRLSADLRQETEDSYIAYTLNRLLTALHAQVQLALNYEAKRHLVNFKPSAAATRTCSNYCAGFCQHFALYTAPFRR